MKEKIMEERKNSVTAPVIWNFLEANEGLFYTTRILKSALYMDFYDYCESIFVIQLTNGTCFIFEHDCGVIAHIKEERNAMEKYMMRIPASNYTEYITF